MGRFFPTYFFPFVFLTAAQGLSAQVPLRGMPRMGGGGMRTGASDSLQFEKRNFADDSVAVRFRYLDTARFSALDTSINDFYDRQPVKPLHVALGNIGNAARSFLFSPNLNPGWDPGMHAFDPYAFTLQDTRFMNTTKPFTELHYLIGSNLEQQIGILLSQNIKPNWNFVVQYRLINAPGAYNAQNTNHSNLRFNTDFTSKNERYRLFFVAISNAMQSSENGGILSDTFLVNRNAAFNDRFNIPTNLADSVFQTRNFFSVALLTGNRHNQGKFLLRQQYDFGKKDSVVTDSSVFHYFLPKWRMEHTISYNTSKYKYLDIQAGTDREFYDTNYGYPVVPDTIDLNDRWKELYNDFSVLQFPDSKNPLQFIKVGATLQNIVGNFSQGQDRFYNISAHGEYRNRTRNRKWDMLLFGEFIAAGRYAGDYGLRASLKTLLSKKLGYLELGFRNVNRTPSYIFGNQTSFPVLIANDLNRENTTQVSANLEFPRLRLRLSGDYFLVSNYTYFNNFNRFTQESSLFNFLRLGLNKEFRLRRSWVWYLDIFVQLTTGDAPVNLPLVWTRNRFAYEGRLFRNLNLSTGFDIRYHTPYKADNYSPVLGQYFLQNQETITIRPDIAAYVNFRIRNFTAFTRLENLNTLTFQNGFGFKYANLAAPLYPTQDLHFRLGVWWKFVN
jgi:Putative porin